VAERPYTVLSCAVSLDGYLAGPAGEALPLSGPADLDRVDEVRAGCDAILVGATTVRRDDPRLLVRSPARRAARTARGRPASPTRVVLTRSGDLDASARLFADAAARPLVYCAAPALERTRQRLGGVATVVDPDGGTDGGTGLRPVAEDLHRRGVRRLLVEGGGAVHTQFLTEGLADELQLVVAPCFVGGAGAPRFVRDGSFPWSAQSRAPLADVRRLDDVVLLRYTLSTRSRADPAEEV
jgi:5-amino-6-(5-phosphoribosylamino)uracil reductase